MSYDFGRSGPIEHAVTRRRAFLVAVTGGILLTLVYFFDPSGTGYFPPCPFHALTGLYCPGCGSLRATHAFLHGHLLAAADLNPLLLLSLPYIAALLFLGSFRNSERALKLLQNPVHVRIFLVLVLSFWVARNISLYPLSLLAP